MTWFEGFEARLHAAGEVELFARTGGNPEGPPLLLLHGYPQTHAMWQRVARLLAPHFSLVIPDLRGLGHGRFAVAGHDRGGRVAHRLALDFPDRVTKLAVIDIVPTLDMYERTDLRFASYYYHWFFLIQPAPLPERMIGGDPKFYLHWTLGGWGANGLSSIEPEALLEYERCFCRADAIHAACEDYRASAGIDLVHDRASRAAGEQVTCDMLVLWGERGVVAALYDALALWRAQCGGAVEGGAVPAGHFIAEELPEETARRLLAFMKPDRA